MTPAAVPRRTCVGCRQARPKGDLVRLGRRADGLVVVDRMGGGRGAYVCRDTACIERALKPGRLAQAFRQPCELSASLGMDVRAAGRRGAGAPPSEASRGEDVRATGRPGRGTRAPVSEMPESALRR